MFLVRKITRAKWELPEDFSDGEIPADAVSVDLKTKSNTLSFWQCASASSEELSEIVLALAAASRKVDTMDIVWLPSENLCKDLAYEDTPGETPIEGLVDRHVNVCKLDYVRLGKVAERIADAIGKGDCRRLPRSKVIEIFVEAVHNGRVKLSSLSERIREEIGAH